MKKKAFEKTLIIGIIIVVGASVIPVVSSIYFESTKSFDQNDVKTTITQLSDNMQNANKIKIYKNLNKNVINNNIESPLSWIEVNINTPKANEIVSGIISIRATVKSSSYFDIYELTDTMMLLEICPEDSQFSSLIGIEEYSPILQDPDGNYYLTGWYDWDTSGYEGKSVELSMSARNVDGVTDSDSVTVQVLDVEENWIDVDLVTPMDGDVVSGVVSIRATVKSSSYFDIYELTDTMMLLEICPEDSQFSSLIGIEEYSPILQDPDGNYYLTGWYDWDTSGYEGKSVELSMSARNVDGVTDSDSVTVQVLDVEENWIDVDLVTPMDGDVVSGVVSIRATVKSSSYFDIYELTDTMMLLEICPEDSQFSSLIGIEEYSPILQDPDGNYYLTGWYDWDTSGYEGKSVELSMSARNVDGVTDSDSVTVQVLDVEENWIDVDLVTPMDGDVVSGVVSIRATVKSSSYFDIYELTDTMMLLEICPEDSQFSSLIGIEEYSPILQDPDGNYYLTGWYDWDTSGYEGKSVELSMSARNVDGVTDSDSVTVQVFATEESSFIIG